MGNGSTADVAHFFPLDVLTESGSGNLVGMVKLISANEHNCGLDSIGEVKCWGRGAHGRIGNGHEDNQPRPVGVILGEDSSSPLSGIVDLARGASAAHSCAQHGEGKLLCWGNDSQGQLGNNITTATNTGFSHPVTVIAGDGSTEALGSISTFRKTYSCEEGGSSCRADSIVLSIEGSSVGNTDSVTVVVSGLTDVQTLELYDGGDCSSRVGILDGSTDPQEIAVSSLSEGLHTFHFMVIAGNDEIVPCSKNIISYVYDNTAPAELSLTVPSASGTDTSVVVTISAIEPGTSVKLYNGSDCSSSHLVATHRVDGVSEDITVDSLTVGSHNFRAQATDSAGNTGSCQTTAASYEVTSL